MDRFGNKENHDSSHATDQEYAEHEQEDQSTKIQLINFLQWRRSQDYTTRTTEFNNGLLPSLPLCVRKLVPRPSPPPVFAKNQSREGLRKRLHVVVWKCHVKFGPP